MGTAATPLPTLDLPARFAAPGIRAALRLRCPRRRHGRSRQAGEPWLRPQNAPSLPSSSAHSTATLWISASDCTRPAVGTPHSLPLLLAACTTRRTRQALRTTVQTRCARSLAHTLQGFPSSSPAVVCCGAVQGASLGSLRASGSLRLPSPSPTIVTSLCRPLPLPSNLAENPATRPRSS